MKAKRKYNNHSRQIKKVTKGTPIVIGGKKGDWKVTKAEDKRGQDKTGKLTRLSDDAMIEMATDKAGGMTDKQLSSKYGVATSYVRDALSRFYLTNRKGKEILKGIYLEGAIATGLHAMTKIKDMSGVQAAATSKIFTGALVDLEKHEDRSSSGVDVGNLEEMAEAMKDIRKELTEGGNDDDDEGDSVLG